MNPARHPWLRMPLPDALAVAALTLGAAMRVWGAWATRCITEPDPAVVGLMARHMAAWKEFPVFFYGQSYMGSLEPMASALMIRLLGSSGFALQLGPVLFAVAALCILWRWARDAAGPWGGLAAVLFGLFGPSVYFKFQMAARGGYMVALWVNALALWAAARMAARLREGEAVGWSRFLALGFLAGLGLWSNLIVVPALAAAALVLLHGMGGRLWAHARCLAAGVAGAAIGLLPWLLYNLRHDWRSLEMSQMSVVLAPSRLLRLSWARFLLLQDDGKTVAGAHLPLVLAWAVLILGGSGAWLAWTRRHRATRLQNYSRAAAVLFGALFIAVFILSGFAHIHSGRYWIPLVPGLAILAAVACTEPGRPVRRAGAALLLAALVTVQGAVCIQANRLFGQRAAACLGAFRELGAALDSTGADALLAPLQLYALNFAIDERVPVSDGRQRFYEPILRAAELAGSPAYTSDYLGVGEFLRQHGARWETLPAAGRHLLWNIRRPPVARRELPREAIAGLLDADGADWREVLTDRNLDTGWSPGAGPAASLEWVFSSPQDMESIRLVFAHGMAEPAIDFARGISIAANVGGQWSAVLDNRPIIPLEWSGPRLYYASGLARQEHRVQLAGIDGLRVVLLDTRPRLGCLGWHLSEATLFTAADDPVPPPEPDAVEDLGRRLRAAFPDAMVYAPRWVSNQLLQRDGVPRNRLPGLAERIFPPSPGLPRAGAVRTGHPAVFVVEPGHAPATRTTLEHHAATVRQERSGPWEMFTVAAGDWNTAGDDRPLAAIWTGDELLVGHTATWAADGLRRLRAGELTAPAAQALFQDLLRWRPSALSALTEDETLRWGGPEAVERRRQAVTVPERPQPTEFANGVRLEGIEVKPSGETPGREILVELYWSVREDARPGREIVFLHVRDAAGRIVAQGDGRGSSRIWGDPTIRLAPGEQIVETRRLHLPAGLSGEPLDLSIGLYRPRTRIARRIQILHSEAPAVRRHAATWPGRIPVSP